MTTPNDAPLSSLSKAYGPIAVAVFLIGWLKGFRLPNLWSATHFAFNYSQGFVRRGFVGELARLVGGEKVYTYQNFLVFSVVVFLVTATLLTITIRRTLDASPRDLPLRAAVLVFAASPGLVYLVHIIGYSDYFGILAVLAALVCCARVYAKHSIFYATLLLSLPLALIHEGLACMFGPVLVLAMGCHILRLASQQALNGRAWLSLLTHAAVAVLCLIGLSTLVSLKGSENVEAIRSLHDYVNAHTDFPIRHKAFDALQRPSSEAIMRVMPWYWSVRGHLTDVPASWEAFLPGFLWLLCYGMFAVSAAEVPIGSRWILQVLFCTASVAPLAFNFVGWDWGRWNALATVSSFMAILTIKLYFPSRSQGRTPPLLLAAGMIVTALGLASTTPLFDGFVVQFFPFQAHQDLLFSIFRDGFQSRPVY